MKHILAWLCVSTLSLCAFGEQKVAFQGHEMHYIVLNTTEIPEEIAARYQISRSAKRAFINLSILKQTPEGYGQPVTADIKAIERTLLGQQFEIELQEIKEGDAIYYIGDFPIFNREVLWFDVELELKDGTHFSFSFDQQVWQE